jgi:hypothetical protein
MINLGKKEQSMNDWQKLTFDIPHEKLILSVRKTRSSFLTSPIQALVIIHQRLDGKINPIFHSN